MKKNPPTVLTLKRKAIRMFPDGRIIALYYSDTLKKYISIPFGEDDDDVKNVSQFTEEHDQNI